MLVQKNDLSLSHNEKGLLIWKNQTVRLNLVWHLWMVKYAPKQKVNIQGNVFEDFQRIRGSHRSSLTSILRHFNQRRTSLSLPYDWMHRMQHHEVCANLSTFDDDSLCIFPQTVPLWSMEGLEALASLAKYQGTVKLYVGKRFPQTRENLSRPGHCYSLLPLIIIQPTTKSNLSTTIL